MSDAVLSNEALLLLILGHLNEQNRLLVLRCCKAFALWGPRRRAEALRAFEALNGTVSFDELLRVPRGTRSETHTYDLDANGFVTIQVDASFESSLGQTVYWPTERAYFAPWSRTMIRGRSEWRVGEEEEDERIRTMVRSSTLLV